MVADNDMGPGKYVPICPAALASYEAVLAAGQTISQRDENVILALVRAETQWHGLDRDTHARAVHRELSLRRQPYSRLVVTTVMQDWWAGVK